MARLRAALALAVALAFVASAAGEAREPAGAGGSSGGSGSAAPAADWRTYRVQRTAPRRGVSGAAALGAVSQLRLATEQLPAYGPSFKDLTVEVTPESAARLHVKIAPTGQRRWEVPESIIKRPGVQAGLAGADLAYNVALSQPARRGQGQGGGEPFALTVTRRGSGAPIFDTRGHRFVFKDQFIELTTALPADTHIYGLGEVTLPGGLLLPRDGNVLTLWNRDLSTSEPHANLYSSHAFYLAVAADGSAHGVYFLNSNGMDVLLNATSLTYRVIGGLVDLYFFTGPSPEEVIRQYHEARAAAAATASDGRARACSPQCSRPAPPRCARGRAQVIGFPGLPPFWALGAHQAKWGYSTVGVVEAVVANYSAAGIPLEGVWVDIDYMNSRFQTLTLDPVRFPRDRMAAFAGRLHTAGQKWVPIHDAGIAVARGYAPYESGSAADVWIKDHTGRRDYLGQVWPGPAVYPDYLSHPNVTAWVTRVLADFQAQVPFDGLWIDMSEASNFCSGMTCAPDRGNEAAMKWLDLPTPANDNISALIEPRTTCQLKCEPSPPNNTLGHPPYAIHNFDATTNKRDAPITRKVIHPTAKHADGTLEYDAHSLYGTAMAKVYFEAFAQVTGKRPFQILRSTFPGAGKWTGHWTGDDRATWQGLFESIASTLNPSLWGIPMVGPDVCGFIDTALASPAQMGFVGMTGRVEGVESASGALSDSEYEELCNRWTSAGAFYPFLRNHMGYFSRNHEPYRWPAVAAAARKAYGLRYRLLTHFYGELALVAAKGGTLARPLFFADSSDAGARNATKQWMMGEVVLVSPVITPNTTIVSAHFTAGAWYSAWDYSRLSVPAGRVVQLAAPLGEVPVHFRGGAVLATQPARALVTRDVRFTPVTLVVTLPAVPSGPRGAAAGRGAAPRRRALAPYELEPECAAAHAANPGRLVSCGLLYQDDDALAVTPDNSLLVWITAAAAPDATRGSVNSTVKAAGGEAARKLRVQAVHVLGVAAPAAGAAPTARVGGREVPAEYDAAAGALRISGLDARAGEPLALEWRL
ncbi:Alpha-glucosidase [Scenedesmus sp. PABB004]|nr:Alpha-glucosidase [Scenedesmus sp. PABB004]